MGCWARKWSFRGWSGAWGGPAHKPHILFLYLQHRLAEENLRRRTFGGEWERPAPVLVSASRHGGAQRRSCGEMGHGRSRCGEPSGNGGVSQLRVKSRAGAVYSPCTQLAQARESQLGARRKLECPTPAPRVSPTPRVGPRVGSTTAQASHPGVGRNRPLTSRANESGRRGEGGQMARIASESAGSDPLWNGCHGSGWACCLAGERWR